MKKLTYIRVEDMPKEREILGQGASIFTADNMNKAWNDCRQEALANKRELTVSELAVVYSNARLKYVMNAKELMSKYEEDEFIAQAIINYLGDGE